MRIDGTINTRAGKVVAPGLEFRGKNQHGRVAAGLANGSIDPSEAAQLGQARNDVNKKLTAYKSNDGRVGPMERRDLHRDLNQISGKIYEFRDRFQEREMLISDHTVCMILYVDEANMYSGLIG